MIRLAVRVRREQAELVLAELLELVHEVGNVRSRDGTDVRRRVLEELTRQGENAR